MNISEYYRAIEMQEPKAGERIGYFLEAAASDARMAADRSADWKEQARYMGAVVELEKLIDYLQDD